MTTTEAVRPADAPDLDGLTWVPPTERPGFSRKQELYRRAMASPAHAELLVILSALDAADALIDALLARHGESCGCDWCAYDDYAPGPGFVFELRHVQYAVRNEVSFVRSDSVTTKPLAAGVAAALRAEAERIERGESDLWPEPLIVAAK